MDASERAFFAGAAGDGGGGEGAMVAAEVDDVGEDELVDVPLDTNTQLQLIFQYYCRFGRTAGGGEETDTIGACVRSRDDTSERQQRTARSTARSHCALPRQTRSTFPSLRGSAPTCSTSC